MSEDTLSDLLRCVRLKGALFFHVECMAPWVTQAPRAEIMAPVVMPDAEHVMEYHVVIAGSCWAGVLDQPEVQLQQGDVIVFPHGDSHMLASEPGMRAAPDIDFLFGEHPPQLPFLLQQGPLASPEIPIASGGHASLLCGFLGCDRRPFNPLLAALPRMIHGRADENEDNRWITDFARLAAAESRAKRPGGEAVLERVSEMMFVDVLRRYLDRLPADQRGWLAGLRDRHVSRALSLLHEQPAHPWTSELLSERVGLSRSALLGLPPMHYLIHWRMQLASQALLASNAPLVSIALEAGYESEAAFSRAFKRTVGMPPSVWRRDRGAASRTLSGRSPSASKRPAALRVQPFATSKPVMP